ncbi:hypothetical protein GW796_05740 [archaeon]|nr:hypothetical protein [archaeon]NCQ51386.1 hypothetical protein [archaeon]NCT58788.1 hypothetical protein [archaeon]
MNDYLEDAYDFILHKDYSDLYKNYNSEDDFKNIEDLIDNFNCEDYEDY